MAGGVIWTKVLVARLPCRPTTGEFIMTVENLANPDQTPPGSAEFFRPTPVERAWLLRGLDQPGGKLPLFDPDGQRIDARTVRSCLDAGWAEPWFRNPLKPDWLVCKLTEKGRQILAATDTFVAL